MKGLATSVHGEDERSVADFGARSVERFATLWPPCARWIR
jgi:hypothetical protein